MEYDAATGVYYDRARYYNPTTGRFESQDPKGFRAGDRDLYRYTDNSPTNATDPSGTQFAQSGFPWFTGMNSSPTPSSLFWWMTNVGPQDARNGLLQRIAKLKMKMDDLNRQMDQLDLNRIEHLKLMSAMLRMFEKQTAELHQLLLRSRDTERGDWPTPPNPIDPTRPIIS